MSNFYNLLLLSFLMGCCFKIGEFLVILIIILIKEYRIKDQLDKRQKYDKPERDEQIRAERLDK